MEVVPDRVYGQVAVPVVLVKKLFGHLFSNYG